MLAGNTDPPVTSNLTIVTHLTSVMTGDEVIQKFWELEEVLGESQSQAVRRFLSLERSLHLKNQFKEFGTVIEEYFFIWDMQKWFPFRNCTSHIDWSTIFQYM